MKAIPGKKSNAYVAFLRGINVGGHNIKMTDLRAAFDSLKLANVRTVLASGNVVFEAPEAGTGALAQRIEEKLEFTFGYKIGATVRSFEELQLLYNANPFKGVNVGPQTRLYVTFLSAQPRSTLPIPYESPDGSFTIISATGTELFSVLILSPRSHTTDLMAVLAKVLGNKITTRNWNTITKVLRA